MRPRRGVSLTEVLVATVLLAVGIGGCVGALLVSARLRQRASAVESVADAVDLRLSWFVARGCTGSDTTWISSGPVAIAESWRVAREPTSMLLTGRAQRIARGDTTRLRLRARRPCP